MYLFIYLILCVESWVQSVQLLSYEVDNPVVGIRFLTESLNLSLLQNYPEQNLCPSCLLAKLHTVTFPGTQVAKA